MVISFLEQKNLRKLYRNMVIAFKALVVTQRIIFKSYIIENLLIRDKYKKQL